MAFQLSPGVNVSEIDLTTGVVGVGTTTGAFAGVFKWGPALEIVLVDSEQPTLVNRFGEPDIDTFISFFTCANFLQYADALNVVRVVSVDALNSTADGSGLLILNDDDYTNNFAGGQGSVGSWAGKYAGELGNSILVSIADVGNFGTWAYKAFFSGAPGTSDFANFVGGSNDEVHVIVIDHLGSWTGQVGAVLETYPFLSKAADAVSADGTSAYYPNAVNRGSKYVRWMDFPTVGTNWGSTARNTAFKILGSTLTLTGVSGGPYVANETLYVGASLVAATKTAKAVSYVVTAATAATITSTIAETYNITVSSNDQVKLAIDGNSAVTVTLTPGVARTAAQIASDINTALSASIATSVGGFIKLTSTTTGPSSSVDIQAPASHSAYTALGFIVHTYVGAAAVNTLTFEPLIGTLAVSDTLKGNTSAATGTIATITPATGFTDSLTGGVDGNDTITDGEKIIGYDLFTNVENVEADLMLGGDASQTLALQLISIAQTRTDCVVFLSPPLVSVVANAGNEVDDIVTFRNLLTSTSYGFMDSNWKYMYDKYNDVYRWVPLNGDIAGLAVRTDEQRDAWWSFAGLNRGIILNVIKLAWNPNKADRDVLYSAGVNPVVSFPGIGPVLYGDKTMQTKPSAFDRINVRRLFIVLEKSIARTAKYTLFEFNDAFTQAQFRSQVEPFLRQVKGARGITDFLVVCDSTNNTPEIVDANQFVGDIYIKPARSINFIQLNFVAVRTGVAFTEVVGQF